MTPTTINIVSSAIFTVAVIHTFSTKFFEHLAHKYPNHSGVWHLLGEVEVVFGFWAMVLVSFFFVYSGHDATIVYLEKLNFTEPLFVFVIMIIAASKPVLEFCLFLVLRVTALLPVKKSVGFLWVTLTLVPLLGSFITEPAAMTVAALLLREAIQRARAALTVAPFIRDIGVAIGIPYASAQSALAAGLVMGVMIIPFVSSMADDSIAAVPRAMRDGSLAMGATTSETIQRVLLPAALPGVVAGVLLAVSRAIGETMIVVMAAAGAATITLNPFDSATTVTKQIVDLLTGEAAFDSPKTLAAFALGVSSGFPYAMIGATLTTRLKQSGIDKASDVNAFLGGGTDPVTSTPFTTITLGTDVIRIDNIDSATFSANISAYIKIQP